MFLKSPYIKILLYSDTILNINFSLELFIKGLYILDI